MLHVLEATFDEFLNNPGWLIDRSGKVNENLKVSLEAMIGVLRTQQDRRLNTRDASQIISAGLKAIARRQEFLEKLPNGTPLVAAVIDAILSSIFRKKNDSEEKVKKLETFMKKQVKAINEGKPWSLELFEAELHTALAMW
jgi:hypothetical protein